MSGGTPAWAASTSELRSRECQWFNEWLSDLTLATQQAYLYDLARFARWLNPADPGAHKRNPDQMATLVAELFTMGAVRAGELGEHYRKDLVREKLAPATVNRRLSTLRSLTKRAHQDGLIDWTLSLSNIRPDADRSRHGFDAVDTLLATIDGMTAIGKRDALVVRLLSDLGLTPAALVALEVDDVDLRDSRIRVSDTWRSLTPSSRSAVATWIQERGAEPGPLIMSFNRNGRGSGRLTQRSVARIVSERGVEAGLAEAVSPRQLRRLAAQAYVDSD